METIRTIYKGNLRTEATHVQSGEKIITDAPVDNHGKGEAFSPTDLLSASLGSCMMTLMGIAANRHQINFDNCSMKITKIMANDPRRIKEIQIDVELKGNYTDKEKAILERSARTCPVALSLHSELIQNVKFSFSPLTANVR